MLKMIPCECGFVIRGDTDDQLVVNAKTHAKDVHGIDLNAEQVLAMAVPAT